MTEWGGSTKLPIPLWAIIVIGVLGLVIIVALTVYICRKVKSNKLEKDLK